MPVEQKKQSEKTEVEEKKPVKKPTEPTGKVLKESVDPKEIKKG